MRHKIIWREPKGKLKNQIYFVVDKHLQGHGWHGACCGTCCDLIEDLEKLFKKNRAVRGGRRLPFVADKERRDIRCVAQPLLNLLKGGIN